MISDVAKISISDHYLIFTCVCFQGTINEHKTKRSRNFKSFDENKFLESIRIQMLSVKVTASIDQ